MNIKEVIEHKTEKEIEIKEIQDTLENERRTQAANQIVDAKDEDYHEPDQIKQIIMKKYRQH